MHSYRHLLLALFLALSVAPAISQTYAPSAHVQVNDAVAPAQATPLEARSMFFDGSNFVYRAYQSTSEVLSYLNTTASRTGNFIIIVDSGGTLQGNGTYLSPHNTYYMFADSTTSGQLKKMNLFGTGVGTCSGCLLVANNLSDLASVSQALINLNLDNVNNTSDATKNAASVSLTNHTINGSLNTLTNLPNSALVNTSIGLTLNNLGTNPNVSTTPAALGTSLVLAIPYANGTNSGFLHAADWSFFDGKLDSVRVSNDSVYNCVNGTCTLQSIISGAGGSVNSVNGTNTSLLFSPTTGNVLGQVNPGFSFNWTGQHTFTSFAPIFSTLTTNGGIFYGSGFGQLLQSAAGTNGQIFESTGGSTAPVFFTPDAATVEGWLGFTPMTSALGSAHILVGNASNIATDVPMTGDVGINNAGATTIQPNVVTYAKIQAAPGEALIGAQVAGNFLSIAVGSGLGMSGDSLLLAPDSIDIGVTATFPKTAFINGQGDSKMFGFDASDSTKRFLNLTGKMVGLPIINNGVSGETLVTDSAAIYAQMHMYTRGSKEIIELGINDIDGGQDSIIFRVQYLRTLDTLHFKWGWPYNQISLVGVDCYNNFCTTNTILAAWNSLILNVANMRGAHFYNILQTILALPGGSIGVYTVEGLHGMNDWNYLLARGLSHLIQDPVTFNGQALAVNGVTELQKLRLQSVDSAGANDVPLAYGQNGFIHRFANNSIPIFNTAQPQVGSLNLMANPQNYQFKLGGLFVQGSDSIGSQAIIGLNTFLGPTGFLYNSNNAAGLFLMSNGNVVWAAAPSGTAGTSPPFVYPFQGFHSGDFVVNGDGTDRANGTLEVIGATSQAQLSLDGSSGNTQTEFFVNGIGQLSITQPDSVGVSIGKSNFFPTALLHLAGSTAARATLRIEAGPPPTAPNSGDVYQDTTTHHLNAYLSGAWQQLDRQGTSNYAHTIFTPSTGGTVNLVNRQYNIINPAGALLALTVNLPSSPANNDVVYIKYAQAITTVTYGNGTVVDGITAPTAGGLVVLTYDSGTTSWY